MGYTIVVGETRPVVTLTGDPILSSTVTDPSGNPPPFAVGLAAQMQDDGSGNLVCVGNFPGVLTFGLTSGGTTAPHEVTVIAGSFDWELGAPI